MDLSVVIPSYRSERLVGKAIESVIAEGVAAENVIVVEDGVFDGTAKAVAAFEGVRLITLAQNRGAPHARNVGLAQVSTRFVMFLDSDDYVENGLLQGLVSTLEEKASDLAIGPWVYEGDGRGRGVLRQPPDISNAERIFHWLIRAFFPPCCIAWKAESVRSIGGWDERLKKDQDGELMIRALIKGLAVAVSDRGNGVYWQHDSPHRVTRAQINDVLYSANVVFDQIETWIRSAAGKAFMERYEVALGRYCCKTAWVAFSYGEDDIGEQWSARARKFGFGNRGYNYKSSLLAAFFGMRMSSRIKARTSSVYRRIAQR
jgi:glycosyltransferase involved in cell wall biosynthesis